MTRRPSDWRKAHGRAAELGRIVVLDNGRDRDLPSASPGDPARVERTADGRFAPGNGWARLAKVRSGPSGVLAALEAKADPAWRAARRWARRGGAHRIAELAKLHGGELSAGVCALVSEAWDQRGDAHYLRARAAADGNHDLLRIAAMLTAGARQAERDAWELASREAAARPGPKESALVAAIRAAGERVEGEP